MILVTGATGLVGSHLLVQLLQENEEVKALFRSEKQIEKVKNVFAFYNQTALFDKIKWVKGDITDIPSLEIAFENITHVYHCAALISFDPSDEDELRKINIEGTANVVNCCIDFGVKKLCHVSSIAALGTPKEHETTITEETEWNPEELHSDYAITKYGAEMEVWRVNTLKIRWVAYRYSASNGGSLRITTASNASSAQSSAAPRTNQSSCPVRLIGLTLARTTPAATYISSASSA
jgi:nucleoside-diphosphate-sugar epimerase